MKAERITIEEVYVVARRQGIEELKDVDVIILETTGDITIMQQLHYQQPRTYGKYYTALKKSRPV